MVGPARCSFASDVYSTSLVTVEMITGRVIVMERGDRKAQFVSLAKVFGCLRTVAAFRFCCWKMLKISAFLNFSPVAVVYFFCTLGMFSRCSMMFFAKTRIRDILASADGGWLTSDAACLLIQQMLVDDPHQRSSFVAIQQACRGNERFVFLFGE